VKRPAIAIVGAGRLGTALAQRLAEAGYLVSKIASHTSSRPKQLRAEVVWFCVPDAAIASVARTFSRISWEGRYAFHSSGVLSSNSLQALRSAGARVASVHPLMTFVKESVPELKNVPFAIEGERPAVGFARRIVSDLGAKAIAIRRQDKVAYHAFATMICPLLVALLAAAERTAAIAGIPKKEAHRRMMPIVRQTLRNYEHLGAAGAFSGPIARGDAEAIRRHLQVLGKVPEVKNVYVALVRAATKYLPSRRRREIAKVLDR
jgi:predicted short-subunit dehydrogenase-like oxidoreductase (DUF2520 family)